MLMVTVIIAGCVSMTRDEYARALPRFPQWRLKRESGDAYGVIHFDSVYVLESRDPRHPGYEIVRFWPSGHYMYKHAPRLDVKEVDSKYRLVIGYYRTQADRRVEIEVFSGFNFGQYSYITGRIADNGDLIKETVGGYWCWRESYPQELRFRPVRIGELKLLPDW